MASKETFKILGQGVVSTANTFITVYTVPITSSPTSLATSTTISSLIICNQNATDQTFSVAIVPKNDTSTTSKHYIFADQYLATKASISVQIGITLQEGDSIQFKANATNISMSAFGVEVQ